MTTTTPEQIAQEFTRAAPIGTPCLYYPSKPFDRSKAVETTIRSEAWALGSGQVVVCCAGMPGGKSIEHIAFAPPSRELAIAAAEFMSAMLEDRHQVAPGVQNPLALMTHQWAAKERLDKALAAVCAS